MRSLAPCLLAAGALVSAPPLDVARDRQPAFRSGADLVRFDVGVTDESGRPIEDLRPDEIEIVEDGQALPILLFQPMAQPAGMNAETALRSLSAEVSSNRAAPRGRLYLLIFDQSHIAPGHEEVARRAAEVFIKTRDNPSDRIAVVGIHGPGPGLGFTADRTRAIAELAKVQNARTAAAQADGPSRDTLQHLSDLLAQYRTLEGRKTVVLFSGRLHEQYTAREMEQVAAAAAQSSAVFYTFDLNRREGSEVTSAASGAPGRTAPLRSLAAETGGAPIAESASGMARLADQAQNYYIVGFTPSAAALAARGEYRRISVRVTRAGARVSARTGYAMPKPAPPPDRSGAIETALAAPFAQQALRVAYTTYIMRAENAGRARVTLSLEADLPLRDAGHTSADVAFVVRALRDGRVVASGTGAMPLPETTRPGAATGLSSHRVHFDVPPGAYLMRAVVHEPGGLVGTADRRLEVRGVAGPGVTVSDLVLGSTTGPLPVRARVFTQNGLSGMLDAYGRSPEQLQSLAVTVALVPAGSDQAIATIRAEVDAAMSTGAGAARRARFVFPLSGVEPGAYLARVTVMAGTEAIAELTREVEILGP